MKILVIGGTRYFGIYTVYSLLKKGHDVTIATRGMTSDSFGERVKRIIFNRNDSESIRNAFENKYYDVVIDKIAYCSDDIRNIMNVIRCDKYILMSSTAVYENKTLNTCETDYDGSDKKLIWCSRTDFSYSEVKRQAENALFQEYSDKKWISVRCPVVLGKDDYTKRLLFYVENIIKSVPMYIDNIECQMSFIHSEEAGEFISFLADTDFTGTVNGSSHGTISLREIIKYVEKKTNCRAVISSDGKPAPFNSECEYGINTEKAESLGFEFSNVKDWIYDLLDYYIQQIDTKKD